MDNQAVAILLAVYNPNLKWLGELLDSLNAQTYRPLHLYVRDDASTALSKNELEEILKNHITNFPFVLKQNESNIGSNQTFAALVTDCNEPYVAFCDQDDIWLPQKIENTLHLLLESPLHPVTVCTNVRIIDDNGNETAPGIDVLRRRHIFLRGEGLAPTLIFRNFALGCTMIAERERLLSYLPFPHEVVHDHYIAFRAAVDGAIDFLAEPQMLYRVYRGNQTGVLTGIKTKHDYIAKRILIFEARIRHFSNYASLPELEAAKEWSLARLANFRREKGGFGALWRTRHTESSTSLFELVAARLPTPLFRLAIRMIQKGYL